MAGHQPVVLIGGGTGSIGDPSGRTSERNYKQWNKSTTMQKIKRTNASFI